MTTIAIFGLIAPLAHAALDGMLPGIRYTQNGGMRFLRIGRYQFSFCRCRQSI